MSSALLIVTVALLVGGAWSACQISSDWINMDMQERMLLANIVVYGRTREHQSKTIRVNDREMFVIDAVFDIYCVFKNEEDPLPETIVIQQIAPRNGCSGTKSDMQIGSEAIVSLKHNFGVYEFHEVMPMLSATFKATKSNLFSASAVCDLQKWEPPQNATVNKCPICGTSNFTDSVMYNPHDVVLPPCFVNGVLVGDGNNCSMFNHDVATNATVCIPSNFHLTCTRLMTQAPSTTCTCSSDAGNFRITSEIDAGVMDAPCLITLVLCLIAFLCTCT